MRGCQAGWAAASRASRSSRTWMKRPLRASKRPLARSATRWAAAEGGRYADSGRWARSGRCAMRASDHARHVGVHHPGADREHRDAGPGQLRGHRRRQVGSGRLARPVGRRPRRGEPAHPGGHDHDPPAAPGDHRRDHVAHRREHPPDVDLHVVPPLVRIGLPGRADRREGARVGDHEVGGPPDGVQRGDGLGHRGAVRDVSDQRQDPIRWGCGSQPGQQLDVTAQGGDPPPAGEEVLSQHSADPPGRPGDHGHGHVNHGAPPSPRPGHGRTTRSCGQREPPHRRPSPHRGTHVAPCLCRLLGSATRSRPRCPTRGSAAAPPAPCARDACAAPRPGRRASRAGAGGAGLCPASRTRATGSHLPT